MDVGVIFAVQSQEGALAAAAGGMRGFHIVEESSGELVAAAANKRGKADSAARGVRVVAACGAALALGFLCAGLLGGRAGSRSALLTLSDGEAWYAANKDYGTDGTEAGVNMVTWYPLHKNASNVERTWWVPHRGKEADVDWYTKHMPRHAAQAASISRGWRPDLERLHALSAERKRRQQMLYGSAGHWGGVGSEGYGTPAWDNTGWNAHVRPLLILLWTMIPFAPCAPAPMRSSLLQAPPVASPRSFLSPARDERADPGTHFFTVCAVPPARRRVDGFGEHGAVVLAEGAQRQ